MSKEFFLFILNDVEIIDIKLVYCGFFIMN